MSAVSSHPVCGRPRKIQAPLEIVTLTLPTTRFPQYLRVFLPVPANRGSGAATVPAPSGEEATSSPLLLVPPVSSYSYLPRTTSPLTLEKGDLDPHGGKQFLSLPCAPGLCSLWSYGILVAPSSQEGCCQPHGYMQRH